jgi:copper chaperone
MDRITMQIDGMSCDHCVRSVREALQEVPGVEVESVEIGSATVSYDSGVTTEDGIAKAIESEGYTVAGNFR